MKQGSGVFICVTFWSTGFKGEVGEIIELPAV